jgi:hypothetical protein
MPPKKKPNPQQQKTIKKGKEIEDLKKKADEFRILLGGENIAPSVDIKANIANKIDLNNSLYSI